MKRFRGSALAGRWWFPEAPEKQYEGDLEIQENNHGKLVLRGPQKELASCDCCTQARTILGQLNEPRHECTLLNAGLMRGPARTYPPQPERRTTVEYFTNEIILGRHVRNSHEPFARGALIHVSGIEEWFDASGFSGKVDPGPLLEIAAEKMSLSFEGKATAHYDIGNGRLIRFISEYLGPMFFGRAKHIELRERNWIELTFSDVQSIKSMQAEIGIWQSFLTVGLRRPSFIDEIFLLMHADGNQFTRLGLFMPGRRIGEDESYRDPSNVLFNRSKFGTEFGNRLKAWRLIQDDIEIAVLLLVGTAYHDSNYIHSDLLTYLQALELLHREMFKIDRFPDRKTRKETLKGLRQAIPQNLDDSLRTQIKEQIGYIGNLTLLDRLSHLYAMYPKCLSPLFRGGDADMKLLKDTRNFLTHFGEQKVFGKEFLWSREIHVLKEKTRLFLEICLLGAMGMTDQEIHELVKQFEPYLGWVLETSIEFANALLPSNEHVDD